MQLTVDRNDVASAAGSVARAVPRSVVLRGPAGIGKSHTLRAVLARLAELEPAARVVRLAGGVGVRSIAFGALMPLLPADGEPVSVEFELVQRLRSAMVAQGDVVSVVAIDDVGLLDEKSAGLIEMLLRQGDIVVVATERTPLTGPPDEHAISSVLRDHADAIAVPPMSDDEMGELIQEWVGPGEVGSVRHIVERSRGNPMVAREMVTAAEADGSIVHTGDLWHLDDFHPSGHTIEWLVGEHLARLADADWELLRCASVAEALPTTVVDRIDRAAHERLQRAGLLVGSPVVLGHPLYGEVTRARMTQDETRQVCSKLLASVTPDDDVDVGRLGSWLLLAGDVIDPAIARAGARRALARWANDLACELLATIPEPTSADHVQLQWAHANCGRLETAFDHANRAVALAADDRELVEATIARSELLSLQLGRADEGAEALRELRAGLDDHDLIARVDGAAVLYAHMTGKGGRRSSGVDGEPTLEDELEEGVDDPAARIALLLGDAFALVFAGQFSKALPEIEEGRRLAEALGLRHNMVRFDVVDALCRLYGGELAQAAEVIDARLREADVSGVRPAHVAWLGLASQVAQIEGRYDVAERRAQEAVRAADHVDDLGAGGFVRGDLGALAAEFGREVPPDPRSSPIGRARHRVRTCPVDEADELCAELASDTAASGYVLWAPWVAREAVRRGPAARCAALLTEYSAQLESPLVASMADHAVGLLDGDLERVEAAAGTFLDHGWVMPALDAGFDAVSLALAHGPTVPMRRALLELSRVMALVTPDVPPRLAERFGELADAAQMPSARQLEIAIHAAAGETSKDIAAQLHLSARTVDNHLAAVYRSLGVSSREELAALGLSRRV